MSTATTHVGPEHDGQRMTLAEFEPAEGAPGYLYELSRGVVTVIDVPKRRHLYQVDVIRQQFSDYRAQNPGRIHTIAAGGECKILVKGLASERHPDLSIYKTAPAADVAEDWAVWIPEIVIEVVSPSSVQRDYVEKREEYLQFGVQEYWIIDADKQEMLVLCRSKGTWAEKTIRPLETYQTHLLPGLKFDCKRVFEAAASK